MRVAAAQMACSLGDVAANVRKMRKFAGEAHAAGAELLVFPEVADTGYGMSVIRDTATAWSDGAVPALQKTAREFDLAIICGVTEKGGDAIYNSQVFIDAAGKTVGRYRKTHLFCGQPDDERECFTAGEEFASFSLGEFQLGLGICYDLRFPEIFRRLAIDDGANIFIISSAWPLARAEHLHVLARARAIENQSYLVLANRAGLDGEVIFCGNSAVIDPAGNVLASAPSEAEVLITADVTIEGLTNVRKAMKVFEHRREEIY